MTIWQTSCRMTVLLMSQQQMRKTKKDLMQVVPMSLMTTWSRMTMTMWRWKRGMIEMVMMGKRSWSNRQQMRQVSSVRQMSRRWRMRSLLSVLRAMGNLARTHPLLMKRMKIGQLLHHLKARQLPGRTKIEAPASVTPPSLSLVGEAFNLTVVACYLTLRLDSRNLARPLAFRNASSPSTKTCVTKTCK